MRARKRYRPLRVQSSFASPKQRFERGKSVDSIRLELLIAIECEIVILGHVVDEHNALRKIAENYRSAGRFLQSS